MLPFAPASTVFSTKRRQVLQHSGQLLAGMAVGAATTLRAESAPLVVLAASDLAKVLPKIIQAFEASTAFSVRLVLGSSGHFSRQIQQGLAFDIFCSADSQLIDHLAQQGRMAAKSQALAMGRLALVSRTELLTTPVKGPLEASQVATQLARCHKLAIANPGHAPYGRAAQEALTQWGLWQTAQAKLVLADNAAQATQFALQGVAQMALVPVALVSPPHPQDQAWVFNSGALALQVQKVPTKVHSPLRQGLGLSNHARPGAQQLAQAMLAPAAQALLREHGFDPIHPATPQPGG